MRIRILIGTTIIRVATVVPYRVKSGKTGHRVKSDRSDKALTMFFSILLTIAIPENLRRRLTLFLKA